MAKRQTNVSSEEEWRRERGVIPFPKVGRPSVSQKRRRRRQKLRQEYSRAAASSVAEDSSSIDDLSLGDLQAAVPGTPDGSLEDFFSPRDTWSNLTRESGATPDVTVVTLHVRFSAFVETSRLDSLSNDSSEGVDEETGPLSSPTLPSLATQRHLLLNAGGARETEHLEIRMSPSGRYVRKLTEFRLAPWTCLPDVGTEMGTMTEEGSGLYPDLTRLRVTYTDMSTQTEFPSQVVARTRARPLISVCVLGAALFVAKLYHRGNGTQDETHLSVSEVLGRALVDGGFKPVA
jgi:hypothetical protein